MPRLAADISNWSGELNERFFNRLDEWSVDTVIVGVQDLEIATRQAGYVRARRLNLESYMQYLPSVRNTQVARVSEFNQRFNPRFMWVAAELTPVQQITEGPRFRDEFLGVMADVERVTNSGIYTNKDNWDRLLAILNPQTLAQYPLWYANYSLPYKVLDAPTWRAQGFGPWFEPSWRQYERNVTVEGVLVDWNVSAD